MQTILKGTSTRVTIGKCQPIVIIGNRINPTTPGIAQALREGNYDAIGQSALSQARDGAHVVNVCVHAPGVEEQKVLPAAVEAVAAAVDLPVALDARDPAALAAALACVPGRPLVNAIGCASASFKELLPLVVHSGAAVVGFAHDGADQPTSFESLVELGREILRQCITAGVPRHDVIVNLPTLPLSTGHAGAVPLLDALAHISRVDDVNLSVNLDQISDGLLHHETIDAMFSALAVRHGATCLIVDPLQGKRIAHIANLLFGKDQALSHLLAGRK